MLICMEMKHLSAKVYCKNPIIIQSFYCWTVFPYIWCCLILIVNHSCKYVDTFWQNNRIKSDQSQLSFHITNLSLSACNTALERNLFSTNVTYHVEWLHVPLTYINCIKGFHHAVGEVEKHLDWIRNQKRLSCSPGWTQRCTCVRLSSVKLQKNFFSSDNYPSSGNITLMLHNRQKRLVPKADGFRNVSPCIAPPPPPPHALPLSVMEQWQSFHMLLWLRLIGLPDIRTQWPCLHAFE